MEQKKKYLKKDSIVNIYLFYVNIGSNNIYICDVFILLVNIFFLKKRNSCL